jgi:hypothetical protein
VAQSSVAQSNTAAGARGAGTGVAGVAVRMADMIAWKGSMLGERGLAV